MSKPETITIDDVKYIRADKAAPELDGEYVIVRCDRSGVFAGIIIKEEGNTAIVKMLDVCGIGLELRHLVN